MTKIKLFLFIFLGSSLSVFGQSTFTLLPKFHVGDTLVYKAKTLNNQNLLNAVPNVNVISRTFQLIVKSEDSNGNLKVDYVMKDVEMGELNEVLKQISIAERIEKFFKEDILRIPIQLTIIHTNIHTVVRKNKLNCPVYFRLKSAADTHCPANVVPVKLDFVETL